MGESGWLFFSAVRTFDKAAIAAALCDPRLGARGLVGVLLVTVVDDLKAFVKAAMADALWVAPPLLVPCDFSWFYNKIKKSMICRFS